VGEFVTDYVKCQRCQGTGIVSVPVAPSNGFTPTRYGEAGCLVCRGALTIAKEEARAWQEEREREREQ
jgi:hypothetical protein